MATARPGARRAAAPAARSSGKTSSAKPARSSGYSGEEGRRKMIEEEAKQKARKEARAAMGRTPFRFFCPVGETREIIIVDDAPNWFRHEHQMKNPATNRWDLFVPCIAEHSNCPACEAAADKTPYFGMFLTVIDTSGYETRDGDQVEWSKKLLVVKPLQQKKITRLFERHKSLRGMRLEMTRDSDKDASIGNEIEFIDFVEEDELEGYVSEYKDQEGKKHEIIGSEVFDYDELFPEMDEDQIALAIGGQANNRESHRRNVRGGSASRDDWQEDERPARTRSARRTTRDDDAEDDEQDTEDEAPARRRAAAPAGRPAGRPAPRRAAREEAEDDDAEAADDGDEAEDEAPAPRRSASRAAPSRPAAGRAAPARRAAREEPEEGDEAEADEDDAPQRRAPSSMADRRRALRGR